MHFSLFQVLAAAGLAAASPISVISPECAVLSNVIIGASATAPAKTFCTSFLGLSATTTTITPTVTPEPVRVTVTSTSTAPVTTNQVAVTDTRTVTTTSTTTLARQTVTRTSTSTSTTVASCLSGTSLAPSTIRSTTTANQVKRDSILETRPTPTIFKDWEDEAVSTACSCLAVTRETSTITSPVTLSTRTTTTTMVVTTTPSTTVTKTGVVTTTATAQSTVTPDPTTTTVVQTVVATTPAANGMNYYVYPNSYNYGQSGSGYTPSAFQSRSYSSSGIISDLNTVRFDNGRVPLPNGSVDGNQVAIVFQGFFYATTTGVYVFSTPDTIDNQLTVWHGEIAYGKQPWTYSNADYDALRAGTDASRYHGGSVSIRLEAGQVMPMTIMWGNNSPAGNLIFYITVPGGTTYRSTDGFFTAQCPGGPFEP